MKMTLNPFTFKTKVIVNLTLMLKRLKTNTFNLRFKLSITRGLRINVLSVTLV